jgi:hypothetical protein
VASPPSWTPNQASLCALVHGQAMLVPSLAARGAARRLLGPACAWAGRRTLATSVGQASPQVEELPGKMPPVEMGVRGAAVEVAGVGTSTGACRSEARLRGMRTVKHAEALSDQTIEVHTLTPV